MKKYIVNKGVSVPRGNGKYAHEGEPISGDLDHWVRTGWVTEALDTFPIENYDDLRSSEVIDLLEALSADELRLVLEREKKKKRPRKTVIAECKRLLPQES